MIACANCGAALPPSARFCMNCGQAVTKPTSVDETRRAALATATPAPLAAKLRAVRTDSERKLVTILFADVVGSTALAERLDPEEWTSIMNRAFECISPAIHRYEGTVARLMGDALVAFFGAPVAHEDDPVRAIHAGLDLLAAVRDYAVEVRREHSIDFDMRVGLNTGMVIVGEVGSDLNYEFTAMGDAVNLAARMQSAAEPGTVLIAENTYLPSARFFEFVDMGQIIVKGKSEPVRAYRVQCERAGVSSGAARGIAGLSSPLIGRDAEMMTLRDTITVLRASRSAHGAIVAVMGEAGLGKSRLVAELRQWARVDPGGSATAPVTWLEGRALSYETAIPYAPFIDMLARAFDLRGAGDEATRYLRIKASVDAMAPGRSGDIAPFLASLIGIAPGPEDRDRVRYLEPPQMRAKVFRAVREWVSLLAAQGPLILVFEDLHWADITSLDLIESLMPLVEDVPLMLMAIFRPRPDESAWRFCAVAGRDHASRYIAVNLAPLDDAQSRELVAKLLEIEDLPERVRALILAKAEGNPFFVEEVIRTLLDAGLVVREHNHWRATREIVNIAVPDNLVGVISARLDRLDEHAKRTAQTAAVIGRRFEHDVLSDICDPDEPVDESLATLSQRELIRRQNEEHAHAWAFKHVLVQETAYGAMLQSRRRVLHRRVAECLERIAPERSGDIAYHLVEARDHARALPYQLQAGDLATRACAIPEARAYYTQALDCIKLLERYPGVRDESISPLARQAYEGKGNCLFLAHDMAGAMELYREMMQYGEHHADVPTQVSAQNKIARLLIYTGQIDEAYKILGRSEYLANQHEDMVGMAEMLTVRCVGCNMTGDFENAFRYMSLAIDLGRRLDSGEQVCYGLAHSTYTLTSMTRYDEAEEMLPKALAASSAIGNLRYRVEILALSKFYIHMRNGNLDAAYKSAEEAQATAKRIGYVMAETIGGLGKGTIHLLRGEYENAIACLEQALVAGGQTGLAFMEVYELGALGSAYLGISPMFTEQVNSYHERAMRLMEMPMGTAAGGLAWAELGDCLLSKAMLDQAEELYIKGLTYPTMEGMINRPRFLLGLARLALVRGQTGEAGRRAGEARQFVDDRRMTHFYPDVAFVEGRVSLVQGDNLRALDRFEVAESTAQPMRLRPMVWQALAAQAYVLDLLGRTNEAGARRQATYETVLEIAGLFRDTGLRDSYMQNVSEQITHPKL